MAVLVDLSCWQQSAPTGSSYVLTGSARPASVEQQSSSSDDSAFPTLAHPLRKENAVENFAHICAAWSSTQFSWWYQRLKYLPFGITQITGIWFSLHNPLVQTINLVSSTSQTRSKFRQFLEILFQMLIDPLIESEILHVLFMIALTGFHRINVFCPLLCN